MTIELRNISKQYGTVTALQQIDLRLEEGQFLTLLGPTGCGKTTLLRIVAGFVQPTAGEVLIGGKAVNDVPPNRRKIGMLFQNYALFPHMTVEQNVSFGLRMQGMTRHAIAKKVDEVLPMVGIDHLRTRYPAQLSGGQQQRTALARTLAIEPQVLLLDEPLAALDRKLKLEMQTELKKLITRLGITTICVSHDQDEALTMSDRIALLNAGRVEQFGAPLELYDRPGSSFAAGFLGNSNLLRGHVRRAGDRTLFECGDYCVELPHDHADGEATLLLRPEHLRLSEESEENEGPSLPGVVQFVTQFGHSVQYEVALDAGPIFLISVPRDRNVVPLPAGARVHVGPTNTAAFFMVAHDSM
jgi:putative spermidine/putrescine transport system ATP-binding protein